MPPHPGSDTCVGFMCWRPLGAAVSAAPSSIAWFWMRPRTSANCACARAVRAPLFFEALGFAAMTGFAEATHRLRIPEQREGEASSTLGFEVRGNPHGGMAQPGDPFSGSRWGEEEIVSCPRFASLVKRWSARSERI